jgi:parallel beta-helix repeat protein
LATRAQTRATVAGSERQSDSRAVLRRSHRLTGRLVRLALLILSVAPSGMPFGPKPVFAYGDSTAADSADCSASLQSQVDAAPPGSTLTVGPCIYRETITIAKPLTLIGRDGTEIRGSDVWTGWSKRGSRWVKGPLPALKAWQDATRCRGATANRCLKPEQVFVDGVPLTRVDADPTTGQFAIDASRNVILADDPTRHTVEVTARARWIVGRADNVTIQNFRMRHAANDAQTGGVGNDGYTNWTIQNNVLSDAHGALVSLFRGVGHKLLGNDISRGGQLGVHGSEAAQVLIQGNHIHDNNTDQFEPAWEAGGLKMSAMNQLTIDGNDAYGNDGPGLWCDFGCADTTLSNNRVHHNKRYGISYEISQGARIFGNVVWENGWGFPEWGWGAGVLVQNSTRTEVYDNTVAWSADGISVIEQNRELVNSVTDVFVHDNTIVATDNTFALAWLSDYFPYRLFQAGSSNRGDGNQFWFPGTEGGGIRFEWNGHPMSQLSDFVGTPGGSRSTYLTSAETEQILQAVGIPTAPESR